MQIVIFRHGRPDTASHLRVRAAEMGEWIESYNAAGIDRKEPPPEDATEMAMSCRAIICSDLPRSLESAEALRTWQIRLSDSIFEEVGLPFANWHLLRLRPPLWVALFRALWFLGFSPKCESYRSSRLRAKTAAQQLVEFASEHESVLFVGHGLLNHFIAGELRSSGWQGPSSPGKGHWEFSVYKRGGPGNNP